LKTISPDVPRFTFVCSIDQYQKKYWAGYIGR